MLPPERKIAVNNSFEIDEIIIIE